MGPHSSFAALLGASPAYSGTLVLTGYQAPLLLIDTATGADRFTLQPLYSPVSAIVDGTRALLFESAGGLAPVTLYGANLAQGTVSGVALRNTAGQIVEQVTTPVMTSRSSLLFGSKTQSSNSWTLSEFEFGGGVKFECGLANHDYAFPTLRGGRWTAVFPQSSPRTIGSFEVPGLEPAATGWVTSRGKVTREGRPR